MTSPQPAQPSPATTKVAPAPKRTRSPLSRGKKFAFRAILLLSSYLLLELVALVVIMVFMGGFSRIESGRSLLDPANQPGDRTDAGEFVHPYFGFMRTPDAKHPDDPQALYINEFGFWDNASPIHKRSADKVIVAIMGGSLAEEFATTAGAKLKELLAASPAFADREVEIVRLAVAGFKQPQQLMIVNYLMTLGAEFDVIINIDGFNEIALPMIENLPNDVSPDYPRSWHTRILEPNDSKLLRLIGRTAYLKEVRQSWASLLFDTPLHYSPLANLVWKLSDDALSSYIFDQYRNLNAMIPERLNYYSTGPRREFADDTAKHQYCVELWKRSSLQLSRLCASSGIEYYHFLQPNQYVAGSKTMSREEQGIAFADTRGYRKQVEGAYPLLIRAGAELKEQGEQFHDLTQAFKEHIEPIYRDGCCHVNERGNEILAETIARVVTSDSP